MGRVVAIDVGQKRIGIAVTDVLQIIATPLDTVHVKDIWPFLTKYVEAEDIIQFVVGYPLQEDGSDSYAMRFVKPFAKKLKKSFPGIPVEMFDERYTSVMAKEAIITGGAKKSKRADKGLVDRISAAILLQMWMDQHEKTVLNKRNNG